MELVSRISKQKDKSGRSSTADLQIDLSAFPEEFLELIKNREANITEDFENKLDKLFGSIRFLVNIYITPRPTLELSSARHHKYFSGYIYYNNLKKVYFKSISL